MLHSFGRSCLDCLFRIGVMLDLSKSLFRNSFFSIIPKLPRGDTRDQTGSGMYDLVYFLLF